MDIVGIVKIRHLGIDAREEDRRRGSIIRLCPLNHKSGIDDGSPQLIWVKDVDCPDGNVSTGWFARSLTKRLLIRVCKDDRCIGCICKEPNGFAAYCVCSTNEDNWSEVLIILQVWFVSINKIFCLWRDC